VDVRVLDFVSKFCAYSYSCFLLQIRVRSTRPRDGGRWAPARGAAGSALCAPERMLAPRFFRDDATENRTVPHF
jgi:hypothetical protein